MTLEQGLRSHFSRKTRERGYEYFVDGFVEDLELGKQSASGLVVGTSDYDASIVWEAMVSGTTVSVVCTCPAFDKYGPCKHIWALALEADAFCDEDVLPLQAPVRVVEGEFLEDPEEGLLTVRGDTGSKPETAPAWQSQLEALADCAPEQRDPWPHSPEPDFELLYSIDLWKTELRDGLTLHLRSRKRLKNGTWGALKEYHPDRSGSDPYSMPRPDPRVTETDRSILAAVLGATQPFAPYYGSLIGEDGYRLGSELCARVLPEIAASGRLYVEGRDRKPRGPLQLDRSPPWHFRAVVEKDEKAGEVRLRGIFERGTTSLALREAELLLDAGFVLHGDQVSRFEPKEAIPTIRALRTSGTLHVPIEAERQLLELATRLPGFEPAGVPDAPAAETAALQPVLYVEPAGETTHHSTYLDCTVCLDYGGDRIDVFEPSELVVREHDGRLLRRDFEAEGRALSTFLECGGRRVERPGEEVDQAMLPAGQLPKVVPQLLAKGWEVEAEGRRWRSAGATSLSVRSGIDWFELAGGIEFGDGEVADLPALLAAAKAGARTVHLGDGSVGVLPERWLESWGLLEIAGQPHGDALRFARHQGWLLDALLAEREHVTVDRGFSELRKRLANFHGIAPKREPKSFHGTLRAYQREGLGWFALLRSLELGGCLADDMGLGKTIQVLALLESRRLNRRRKGGVDLPSLVVAPRSLVFNWIEEAKRFTPKLRVLDYTGTDRRERLAETHGSCVDLLITTYGTLRRDIVELREEQFDYVILDESQAVKNASSQSAKAVRLLSGRHRLALSGTPIENHLGELWSLFEFLNPGMLGASRSFQRFSRGSGKTQESPDLELLSRAIAPFFLRRTKDEVLSDLPEKTEQVLHCTLKGPERKEYDRLRNFYRASLASQEKEVGLSKMKVQVLTALLRLRQAACHPGLIDKRRTGADSAKLNALLPMLEELHAEGHKALVFSQFTSLLSILRRKLDERGLGFEYLDGRTRKRQEKVEHFQSDPDCRLFLISIKAGGHGLNLTAADYVFLLDPWWNPAVEAQAIDRVHRIGRTKPVVAYRLIATDTVEEKVVELQEHKRRLADAILGQGRVGLRDLTREDLELLLA